MGRRERVLAVGAAGGLVAGWVAWRWARHRSPRHRLDTAVRGHPEVGRGDCRVAVVSGGGDWAGLLPDLRRHLALLPALGLDCEWVAAETGGARPVCLLQLATAHGLVIVIRLLHAWPLPAQLRELLASPEIYKVGVAVTEDGRKLLADHGLEVGGCVDLRHLVLAGLPDGAHHPGKLGLEALAAQVLGVTLDKDWRVRAGDWEADTLTDRQVNYAANDALVAVNILWTLLSRQFSSSPLRALASTLWPQARLEQEVGTILDRFVDLDFNNRDWKQRLKGKSPSPSGSGIKGRHNSTRKTPLYHNCMLQAPDGQVLCTCDTKKALWYISKGIGYKVSEDPLIVKLRFEPSGRPEGRAGEYYLTVKPNICVVCGEAEAYLRKNVVPHEYRRYFPAVMKDHQSHDVLLMCVHCHQVSNLHDGAMRRTLAAECAAPVGVDESVKLRENSDLKRIRSAGRALQANRKRGSIPASRLAELEQVLVEHFQADVLTPELVDEAAGTDVLERNGDYVPHSRAVVLHHLETDGLSLLQFETRWRKHFIRTMKPKFLHELWSVDHQAERLQVKAKENRIDLEQYKLATDGVNKGDEFDLEEYRNTKQAQLGINPDTPAESEDGSLSR